GGLLLAYAAFKKLAAGLWHLAGAAIAWEQVAPLFQAAARPEVPTPPARAPAPGSGADTAEEPPLLEAHDLVFRYRPRGEPVLRGISLRLGAGERILLEGPSGGGKSTLATLLTGLRLPESGLLLLGGLDRQTLGAAGWQRRVVAAPPVYDNHGFGGSLGLHPPLARRRPPPPPEPAPPPAALPRPAPAGPRARHARRRAATGGRDWLAALPRRTQPALPGARRAARCCMPDPRRELRRAGPRHPPPGAALRPRTGPDAHGDCPPLTAVVTHVQGCGFACRSPDAEGAVSNGQSA